MINMDDVKQVYSRLSDDTSSKIFMAYFKSWLTDDLSHRFALPTYSLYYNSRDYQLVQSFGSRIQQVDKVVVVGGRYCDYVLQHLELFASCDFSICGIDIKANEQIFSDKLTFSTYEQFFSENTDLNALFIVAPHVKNTVKSITENLLEYGVKEESIFEFSDYFTVHNEIDKKQYFDFFIPDTDEIFVAGGTYDGNSTLRFVEWCNGSYKSILAFEAGTQQYMRTNSAVSNLQHVSLRNTALWNKTETVELLESENLINSAGFSLVLQNNSLRSPNNGVRKTISVEASSLDDLVKDEKITFIKLDIEGSELKALKGAERVIRDLKPKLAVCIYHRPDDFMRLPQYLLELNPDYRFALRHYSYNLAETVLYAFGSEVRRRS